MRPAVTSRISHVRLLPCVQRMGNPGWRFARGRIAELPGWIVELGTEDGTVGHGYVEVIPVVSTTPAGARAAMEELAPLFLGADPFAIEALLIAMDRRLGGHRHVKSAFDCALHELTARLVGRPLHQLFGGTVHRNLPLTRIVPLAAPAAMADDAEGLVGKGYRYLKVKLSGESDLDIARVAHIRERVGQTIRLSVDPNQAYDVKTAIATLRRMAVNGVDLVEQPVRADDFQGLKQVRDALDMTVEADESVTSVQALLQLISMRALDSANLKVADLGGLRHTLQAARLCEAAGIGYRIGATFGPRLMAAQSLHLASTFTRITYAQELAEFDHLLDDPYHGLDVRPDGSLQPGDGAGCGLSLSLDLQPAFELCG